MRAVELQEANLSAAVAKENEVLAQDADALCQILQLGAQADRMPVAAKVFTARRSRADLRQLKVRSGHLAVVVAAIGLRDRLRHRALR